MIRNLRQGDVALGLSEYTSRRCRLKLVEATARAIQRELEEKYDRGMSHSNNRVGAARLLAGILEVSPRTVQRWLAGGVQSCNVNAERIIQVALKYDEFKTVELLQEDLENHRFMLNYMANGRQGDVAPPEKGPFTDKVRQGVVA